MSKECDRCSFASVYLCAMCVSSVWGSYNANSKLEMCSPKSTVFWWYLWERLGELLN